MTGGVTVISPGRMRDKPGICTMGNFYPDGIGDALFGFLEET